MIDSPLIEHRTKQILLHFSYSILMTEAYTILDRVLNYYGKVKKDNVIGTYCAEIPFIFEMQVKTKHHSSAREIKKTILECVELLPRGEKIHPNWVVSIINTDFLSKKLKCRKSHHFAVRKS